MARHATLYAKIVNLKDRECASTVAPRNQKNSFQPDDGSKERTDAFALNVVNRRHVAFASEGPTSSTLQRMNGAKATACEDAKIVCLIGVDNARKANEGSHIQQKSGSWAMGRECALNATNAAA